MQQQLYDLIMWGIIFSHWVNLKLALWFHTLLIVMMLCLDQIKTETFEDISDPLWSTYNTHVTTNLPMLFWGILLKIYSVVELWTEEESHLGRFWFET